MINYGFNRLLCLGIGAVQQNVLTILDDFFPLLDYSKLTLIDKLDKRDRKPVQKAIAKGAKFVQITITPSNYSTVLQSYVSSGDQIIDLTVGVDCVDIVRWCLEHNIKYINTALELWETEDSQKWYYKWKYGSKEEAMNMLQSRTLHQRQYNLRNAVSKLDGSRATCVIDHGMNPGLVSHFAKSALEKIVDKVLIFANVWDTAHTKLKEARRNLDYAQMAMILGLNVIHVSERDNQVPKAGFEKKPGEFLSTWSCEGFFEEGLDPVQVGWGTHEKVAPYEAMDPVLGELNQKFIPYPGVSLKMKSFVPTFGEIEGFNIPHSEASTLSSFLSIYNDDGSVLYRPTVHYVYSAPQCAVDSWEEVLVEPIGERKLGENRVLTGTELKEGKDAVGVLLIFKNNPFTLLQKNIVSDPWCYWAGTLVSVEQNLEKSGPYSAPTTVQVAASVLACVQWMAKNDSLGLLWPESVEQSFVLDKATPYLGDVLYGPVDWDGISPELQFSDFVVSTPSELRLSFPPLRILPLRKKIGWIQSGKIVLVVLLFILFCFKVMAFVTE